MYRKVFRIGQRIDAAADEVAGISKGLGECFVHDFPEEVALCRQQLELMASTLRSLLPEPLHLAVERAGERMESPAGWCSVCGAKWLQHIVDGRVVAAEMCLRCRSKASVRTESKPEEGLAEAYFSRMGTS